MTYRRLCIDTYNQKGSLVPDTSALENLDYNKPAYLSIFKYNTEHLKKFQKTGSIAGIKDVTTDQLVWDLDSKSDLEKTKSDTLELFSRFKTAGIPYEAVQLYFSGNKGFSVVVKIDRDLNPIQFREVCTKFGEGLETLDLKIYDAARIFRVPFTKHPDSGLYKIPLNPKNLKSQSIDTIKHFAAEPEMSKLPEYTVAPFQESWLSPRVEKKPATQPQIIDISQKPSNWKSCKWNILQGNFGEGERHQAMLVLAATCRGMGMDKITTYHICKSSIEKEAVRNNREKFDKDELWKNIIEESVFTERWEGGTFSCKTDPWLSHYCKSLGENGCKESSKDDTIIPIGDTFGYFKDFAENIDEYTIKTGIKPLDKNLRLTIGMLVGLVAPAASGKTSLALQMLNTMSNQDVQCAFFSYDMYHSLVFQKLVQKHFGMNSEAIFNKFKEKDAAFQTKVLDKIKSEYKNVSFCFETGQTIDQMMKSIEEAQDKTGKKIRFIVIDYNELIISDKQDSTAASAHVIQSLRAIASIYNACVLVLLQPNKLNANPSEEITTYQAAKGSSSIAQAVSVMLGVSRPGYDPRRPSDDKFMTIKCLKNRMGSLFSLDLSWNGLTGEVRELNDEEFDELRNIKERQAAEKSESGNSWS